MQYVFEVPPIDLDECKREPYVDQLASEMYEATLETYLKNCADRTTAAEKCSTRGCSAKRVRYSGVCFKHYEERRPVPPPGRTLT